MASQPLTLEILVRDDATAPFLRAIVDLMQVERAVLVARAEKAEAHVRWLVEAAKAAVPESEHPALASVETADAFAQAWVEAIRALGEDRRASYREVERLQNVRGSIPEHVAQVVRAVIARSTAAPLGVERSDAGNVLAVLRGLTTASVAAETLKWLNDRGLVP